MTTAAAEDWRAFQERVAALFRGVEGCTVSVGERLHGSRIGTVETDVICRFRPRADRGLEFMVVVECKLWRKRIPQENVFAVKTIVEDVGASMGILVSEAGVQGGALKYLSAPSNIYAMTFAELQDYVGHWLGTCSACGAQANLPFKPDPTRLARLLCRDCHRKRIQSAN